MNPDVVERNAARQTGILASNKRGQVFHMNIRTADIAETLAGPWFAEKNTLEERFVAESLAVELGETLNKHSSSCLRKPPHFALEC